MQIVATVVGIILPRVMLSCYGSEINGLISSITQFISYFSLVEAGLANAAIYALFKPIAEKNQEEMNIVLSTTKKMYYFVGYIFILLVLALSLIYPFFVKTNILDKTNIFFLVLAIGCSGAIDFFSLAKYKVLLSADQKSYMISIGTIIYYLINTTIIIVLAKLGMNIAIVKFVALIAVVFRSIILYIYVKKRYGNINYNAKKDKTKLEKRWDALYLQILGAIQQGAPVIILTFFTNLISVSIYSIYNMVLIGINGILSVFISGLSSSFGDIIIRKEQEKLKKTTEEFEYIYYNLLTLVYPISLVMIMPFIKLYTEGITDVNYNIPLVGILFVINGLLYNIKTPQGMLVISAGMYKETKIQTTIQGLIIVVIGIPLTILYGLPGIIIASILSNLYRVIDLLIFIPKRLTKTPIINTLKKQIKIFIIGTLICIIGFNLPLKINNYFEWTFFATILMVISCIILFIYDRIFHNDNLKKLFLRIKMILGGKNENY